jgi:hypothetical protein
MYLVASYDPASISIEGSDRALRRLSEAIEVIQGNVRIPLIVPVAPLEAHVGFANSLRLESCEGLVCVSRAGDEISIRGESEKLKLLARNIAFLAGQVEQNRADGIKNHLHIEFHPGHFYLREDSLPLVVTKI